MHPSASSSGVSYIMIVQYQSQKTDLGIKLVQISSFIHVLCVCVCGVQLYHMCSYL